MAKVAYSALCGDHLFRLEHASVSSGSPGALEKKLVLLSAFPAVSLICSLSQTARDAHVSNDIPPILVESCEKAITPRAQAACRRDEALHNTSQETLSRRSARLKPCHRFCIQDWSQVFPSLSAVSCAVTGRTQELVAGVSSATIYTSRPPGHSPLGRRSTFVEATQFFSYTFLRNRLPSRNNTVLWYPARAAPPRLDAFGCCSPDIVPLPPDTASSPSLCTVGPSPVVARTRGLASGVCFEGGRVFRFLSSITPSAGGHALLLAPNPRVRGERSPEAMRRRSPAVTSSWCVDEDWVQEGGSPINSESTRSGLTYSLEGDWTYI